MANYYEVWIHTPFQFLGPWDLFQRNFMWNQKNMTPKKAKRNSPVLGIRGPLGAWLGPPYHFQTWHQLANLIPFPNRVIDLLEAPDYIKGRAFFLDFGKGIYFSQSGFFWKHIKFCRFLGKRLIQQNEFFWVPDIRSKLPSQASRQRFEKGTWQIATFKYPKPQTRNLSYNHWFYTALRSCSRGGNTQTPEGMFNTFVVYMLSPKISLNDPKNERSPLTPPN